MTQAANQRFWNRIAERYAARPLKNVPAYEAMLADVAARLKDTDKVLEIGCTNRRARVHCPRTNGG